MSLPGFHPVVQRWFAERFDAPTRAQERGWVAIRAGGNALIAAPTGSGKTLAAFLTSIDDLLREGLERGGLPDEVRVIYVSPLKALTADIHKNLAEPRREIRQLAESMGLPPVRITAAMRTGDTSQAERAAMLRQPPHILVTTPESLYLLLTAERSREMLRTARTVIVDEIHAVVESRRGAHLALSLERLEHVASRPLQRIGLSATQKPIEEVAGFLVGARADGCTIVDEGHARELDLALEVTGSPLEAVMPAEAWTEIYDRLARLVEAHRTTLVFVNTRRLCERLTRQLSDRLGEDAVTAHHGSLSKEARLDAEDRLKHGRLRALVATASLELGIDVGAVDLVCQIGSPRRIATFLQRVGRSGHTVHGTPKGRLFPLSRDELVECTALLRAVRRGELDRVIIPEQPLDVLAQQIVAESACEGWDEDALFALVRRAHPYRALERKQFDDIVEMLGSGYATRRGRRGALIHHDGVNRRLRGRKGARFLAITSGGAIPEVADYRAVTEPGGTFIGTLNEDFAVESMPGDIFQLGNASWLILKIEPGVVRVADAQGQPPSIPFWLGEAPARSVELSAAVSDLRKEIETHLAGESSHEEVVAWLASEAGIPEAAAAQIVAYLAETRRLLGVVPTQETLVLERFFDDAGGMQLVLHAPFGGRVTRAWGLALRKRFCRKFNFELQAAATDEGLLLSLGPQHSFPLDEVFQYLHPATVEDILVQAVLDAPVFQTRWRWNANISLAVPRSRNGGKVPPPIQRMQAEDLLAAAFPDAAACLENIPGDRTVPDHPLVRQTLRDCLEEAMDLPALTRVLERLAAGEIRTVARDTPEPSPLSHQILNARVYEFLDDATLEERRAQAVYTRRALEPSRVDDLGALDVAAIERVRAEAWPEPTDPDELHDALVTSGFLTESESDTGSPRGEAPWGEGTGTDGSSWRRWFSVLTESGRAARLRVPGAAAGAGRERVLWIAAERLPELRAIFPDASIDPEIAPPLNRAGAAPERSDALRDVLRGRLEIAGPVTAAALGAPLGLDASVAELALAALEADGVALRGYFTPGVTEREWCERGLLARIHRYTLNRLRAEIEPVSAADFMRFLFRWQRVEPEHRVAGMEGLAGVLEQLDGFELAAAAWEGDVLPARCEAYGPELLDALCLTGRVAWGRLSERTGPGSTRLAGPLRSSPMALFLRPRAGTWLALARPELDPDALALTTPARLVLEALERRGASFFPELATEAGLLPTQAEQALGELAAHGLVTSDSFAGLRALLTPSDKRKPIAGGRRRHRVSPYGVDTAGRWSLLGARNVRPPAPAAGEAPPSGSAGEARAARQAAIEAFAQALLRRWGVVFRRLLAREPYPPTWRELVMVYRRLEARGEIRGGRFVAGLSGEQFALPAAVEQLRAVRKVRPNGSLLAVSAADPLNLVGILTPGDRIPATARNRILYRDGAPIAAREGGCTRLLVSEEAAGNRLEIERALGRRGVPAALRTYLKSTA